MMIIKTPRSLPGRLIDGLLTALAWLVLLYLLFTGIRSALAAPGLAGPIAPRWMSGAHTVLIYPIISICIGLILYFWANYNAWRFGNKDRRKTRTPITDRALAESFRLSPAQIGDLHASRSVRIRHTQDGLISSVTLAEPPGEHQGRVIELASRRPKDTFENKIPHHAADIDCKELQVK